MTTSEDIKNWIETAKAQNATHLIVVCDTFDCGDYPVYVAKGQDVREVAKQYDHVNMQEIMEVYDLGMDIAAQLGERRARHGA